MSYIELSGENFEQEVLSSEKPVLVDFWAPWCGPCQAMSSTIEKIASDYSEKVKVGKVNIDNHPDLANKYRVMSIPTLLLFKSGEVEKQHIGMISKDKLVDKFSL